MLRGPSAIGNAVLAPFRSSSGAVRWAVNDSTARSTLGRIVRVPALGGISFVFGFIDTAQWLATGLADTLTGGYFEFAPDEAAHLSVAPLQPFFVPGPRPERPPCGARAGLSGQPVAASGATILRRRRPLQLTDSCR